MEASHLTWLILDVGVGRPNQTWHWPSWLVLTPRECARLTRLLSQNEQPVWKADGLVAHCFEKIARIVDQSQRQFDRTRMVLYVNELLMAILDLFDKRDVPLEESLTGTERNVELFLRELRQYCADPWTLDSMAEQVGLKRSQFTNYCRQLTNRTPMEYLAHARVDAAKQLLIDKRDLSVTQVAMVCGFSTSQYFATTFRRITGLTPREYRESLCQQGEQGESEVVTGDQ